MGGLCGACLYAASNQPFVIGAILGAVGGVIGAFAGYEIRRRLVAALHVKDIFVALLKSWSRSDSPVSSFHADSRRRAGFAARTLRFF